MANVMPVLLGKEWPSALLHLLSDRPKVNSHLLLALAKDQGRISLKV